MPGHTPSPSQRRAIEAEMGPVLVIAGPGAGKTFCLVERIRHLITVRGIAPERICAFTFTNKAANEISDRLTDLPGASEVHRGTIHAFCAELLRTHGAEIGVMRGFGIADEAYQGDVLARLGTPARWQKGVLTAFARHRFRDEKLEPEDAKRLQRYEAYLGQRNVLDFDQLVIRAAGAMEVESVREAVRARFDYLLVDEFQDLNPVAFQLVTAMLPESLNVFAVGDDEQSIYAWAGADPRVFGAFLNAFPRAQRVALGENRRCPAQVMGPARRLIDRNRRLFDDPKVVEAPRQSHFPVTLQAFDSVEAETTWLLQDVRETRAAEGLAWGDLALLYRTNDAGGRLEAAFLGAGVPCRMSAGRALADHPVVVYLLSALRVILHPNDPAREAGFFRAVLPPLLFADARARAEQRDNDFAAQLEAIARERKKTDAARMIRRAQVELQNLAALGERHATLDALLHELLSQRVGQYRSALDDLHDELSDPIDDPDVRALARDLEHALVSGRPVVIAPMQGVEFAIRTMFGRAQLSRLLLERPWPGAPLRIGPETTPALGAALGTFKALQLVATREFTDVFADFVALDFEATDLDPQRARIIEIGAVRVRSGQVVDRFQSLVQPGVEVPPVVTRTTGIDGGMLAGAPTFAEVWPTLREFLGRDLVIAHNGHTYDFPLLKAEVARLGEGFEVRGYDTLPLAREVHAGSARLESLAAAFGVPTGASHRALDDTVALAGVVPHLNALKFSRMRKTALGGCVEALALGLALTPGHPPEAARLFAQISAFPLFRHATSLDAYRDAREAAHPDWPSWDQVVERLGGIVKMAQLRRERDADDRYPELMARLRRVLDGLAGDSLEEQIRAFLETIVLSQQDGVTPDHDRVNLLTLHSTKGLEFKHVYIVGASNNDIVLGKPDRWSEDDIEEGRRLLYVGMTRAEERLVLTVADTRGQKRCDDRGFLAEMGLTDASD
ncbi:MAG: UvrD-helicase domain-containing protein [Gemmatimonadetes bacterium]|nr:UvrD-helicase domain-containing protein [Gemmatimonadota bacterium]